MDPPFPTCFRVFATHGRSGTKAFWAHSIGAKVLAPAARPVLMVPIRRRWPHAVIVLGGIIAALAGATQIITKSTHEAEGIPTKEANADGVRATRMAIGLTRGRLPVNPDVMEEKRIILKEASAILDKTLEMGEGDPVVGALRSLQAGVLDIPWAPNRHVAGKVIPILDASRAVRYLHHAGLPLDNEVLDYHREKIREREKKEGRPVDFEAAIQDVTEVSQMLEVCGYEEGH